MALTGTAQPPRRGTLRRRARAQSGATHFYINRAIEAVSDASAYRLRWSLFGNPGSDHFAG